MTGVGGGRVLSPFWRHHPCGGGFAASSGRSPKTAPPARDASVVWHEVECGAYTADLELWRELASGCVGPILDIGCGTGRVALCLARSGYVVQGIDVDPDLVGAFNKWAGDLPASARVGDARDFALDERFGLALAPMQVVQLLSDAEERLACLRRAATHLRPGGRLALAIVEELPRPVAGAPPLPDAREVDGWVYSSLPLETVVDETAIAVRRLRQVVSPGGGLSEEVSEIELRTLSAETLEREAVAAGLRPAGRREIPATEAHVGSTVVVLEREG